MTSAPVSFAAKYYSDRFVRFEVRELPAFLALANAGDRRYRCYVQRAGDPISEELLAYLGSHYQSRRDTSFVVFDLTVPISPVPDK